ncbi:hypothetical protein S7711_02203 [Stachybotrys chartarum IBT 7711]|uniref:Major facilitator superfamily (MFS) profile domain-containing protein n=1 Tax=Stachybotrys chartarum (strain CBS 109288 / IBT 7711) TaxID=1280523 RepID=A0A084AZ70_STACB|nr:hypothetical protein S7711_02203 [Stachybotrys chartarum IBT 7711]KFA54900.1 hypothetical protein S40293_08559 [Stachybotrys chartarum IBT 40293]KFA76601.1 hypothetical protein S40288_08120 [Stachybotrys chartarum IBT 40288]
MEKGADLNDRGRQPPAADSAQESKEASVVDSSPQKDETAPDGHLPGEDAHDAPDARQPRSPYDGNTARRLLTPKNCRWDAASPPPLTTFLCVIYALAGGFTVSNLYYNQPILNRIADDFGVSYETSAQVPTLMQAGYAAGLVFILPLGDMLQRRPFIISLVFFTATVWIGLCVTWDFAVFRALSFVCGVTTVTPQLLIPLVGDFAPERRKAAMMSIVVSGLLLGMLTARLLSGIVANYTEWRNIYWIACGLQYLLAALLFCFMPDYPSTNPDGLSYLQALRSIPVMMATQPVLIQASLTAFAMSAVFTGFWTTLTFLLASPPYSFPSVTIGLFSLLGIVAMVALPIYGRFIDRYVPLFSVLLGQALVLVGCVLGTSLGTFTVAGPILQGITMDIGMQTAQVANRASIFSHNPKARSRTNTAYTATSFAGQLTGTAVGNRLYAEGGWIWSGGCGIAFIGASMLVSLARGPRETGWVGWGGGWRIRKDPKPAPKAEEVESGVVAEPATEETSDSTTASRKD